MVTLCLDCMTPTRVHTWEEVNWEPYGETTVRRTEKYEQSICCEGEVMELTDYQVADSINDIVPENYKFYCSDESLDALYMGDITDMEQALLIQHFNSDMFYIKAIKVSEDPTEEQKINWMLYCWIEDLMCMHCNYNTYNYTEYRVEVYDNVMHVRWRL